MAALPLALLLATAWAQDQVEGLRVRAPQGSFSVTTASIGEQGQGEGSQARAEIPGQVPVTLRGDKVQWSFSSGEMTMSGHVTLTRGDLTVRCDQLTTRARAAAEPTMTLRGPITATWADQEAHAEQGTLVDSVLTLEGSPSWTSNGNRLVGARIRVWLREDRAECEQCTLWARAP